MRKRSEIFYNILKKAYCFNGRTFCTLWEVQHGFFGLETTEVNDQQVSTPYPISTLTSLTHLDFYQTICRRWDKVVGTKMGILHPEIATCSQEFATIIYLLYGQPHNLLFARCPSSCDTKCDNFGKFVEYIGCSFLLPLE